MNKTQAVKKHSGKEGTPTSKEALQEKAPVAYAFGCTFVLAPAFCLKLGKEDALLLASFTQQEGLAFLVHSELKASARVVELFDAETGVSEPDALLGATLGADALLGAGAQRLLAEPNAGGASRISEAFSMEVLSRAFGASLDKTELEIVYWPRGAITDFSIELEGAPLGVSVTRALTAPRTAFDEAAARALLTKKLSGILKSTETCLGAWRKQLLHVFAPSCETASVLEAAYATLPHALVCDTVVLVTTCDGLPQLFEERMSRPAERAAKVPKGAKEEAHLRVLAESDPCRANVVS